jgi:hypothetical protein
VTKTSSFNKLLESIARLSIEEQEMLTEIVRKRIIERRREELAESIRNSRQEYRDGLTGHGTVQDFINEIEKE